MVVGELARGVLELEPAHPVDLLGGLEGPPDGSHQPVPDDLLTAAAIDVFDDPQRPGDHALEPGLLFDLAEGRRFEALVRLDLALGERPVVVPPPGHPRYPPLPPPRLPLHHPPPR